MKVVGLTGGIASGKTTVANHLRKLGAAVIDADVVARQVVIPGEPAWKKILGIFGPDVFRPDGTLDRVALGRIVFSDPTARQRLNDITHPFVFEVFRRRTEELAREGKTMVIWDVPLLLETGMDRMTDEVWVVAIDEGTQLHRLMERDRLDETAARARISSQMPLAEKVKKAHRIIDAKEPLNLMLQRVERYWKEASGEA
ncbi:dephospho-CoA kinase [Heliobacterium chlorum]|uniref:Dephospho-CoA kinase n=1 Tax=Heliobacterium chlorum TaxID=2698 RepID=A0ABR7SYR6_HELCL|nr:dephospho-CoA kinase [Heliobacterium chlorum]